MYVKNLRSESDTKELKAHSCLTLAMSQITAAQKETQTKPKKVLTEEEQKAKRQQQFQGR
jgi:hypothetical protein